MQEGLEAAAGLAFPDNSTAIFKTGLSVFWRIYEIGQNIE
jgi:hypothetical protein